METCRWLNEFSCLCKAVGRGRAVWFKESSHATLMQSSFSQEKMLVSEASTTADRCSEHHSPRPMEATGRDGRRAWPGWVQPACSLLVLEAPLDIV